MFFILSKTAAVLILPTNFLMLIGIGGIVLTATRLRRTGVRLMIASLVLLLLAGVLPLGALLIHALESRFPAWDTSRGAPTGAIILGGTLSPELSRVHGGPVVGEGAGRLIAIAKLARDYPDARIVYSGGSGELTGRKLAEADYLYPLLDIFGVARTRVMLEPRSRNTAENAAFSKELVKPQPGERWLLVTSAQHMPRAIGSFRRVGFDVEAYPVAWRTGLEFRFIPSLDIASNHALLDSAAKEFIGLAAYWITGRTSALYPSP